MPRCLALIALAVWVAAPHSRADDEEKWGNPVRPTPHRDRAAIERAIAKLGLKPSDLAEAWKTPRAVAIVGAATRLTDGRYGFMPLFQHHMAVEHWLTSGLEGAALDAARGTGPLCFVKLEAEQQLLAYYSPFGGKLTDGPSSDAFFGNGLAHGGSYGRGGGWVMGYHERIYQLAVKKVLWAKSPDEFAAARAAVRQRYDELHATMERGEFASARDQARALAEHMADAGYDDHEAQSRTRFIAVMLLLDRDPSSLSADELLALAQGLGVIHEWPNKPKKAGVERATRVVAGWPAECRSALATPLIAAWMALGYRYQRDRVSPVISALACPESQRWEAEVAQARRVLAELKAQIAPLCAAGNYARVVEIVEQSREPQRLAQEYVWDSSALQHWWPAAQKCAALEAAWSDPAKRRAELDALLRFAVLEDGHMPNTKDRPRLAAELSQVFLPRLEAAEKRRVEQLLVELGRGLTEERFLGYIAVAELLVPVAGDAGKALYRDLIRLRKAAPSWQVDTIRRHARQAGAVE